MAESDGKAASNPLSTEEADRLSEKFKPSWEAEPEPPTVPKVEPPKPMLGKQTLLGVAPPVPIQPAADAASKAPDDLDWELPADAAPTTPITETPIEPPPKSNPSGIGQTYIPKDTDAPAIVLKDEVKRAEAQAVAQLEAEHKSRSAPTVLKFKAIEAPQKAVADDDGEPPGYAPPKKGLGVWIGLGAGAISVALIGIMVVVRGTSDPEPLPPPPPEPPAQAQPKPAEPPPPPPATPAPAPEPPPPEPVATAAPSAEPPKPEVVPEAPAEPTPPPKRVAQPKPAPAPKPPRPVAAAPKPPPAAPKPAPAPKPPSAPKPASGGIVRDAPF